MKKNSCLLSALLLFTIASSPLIDNAFAGENNRDGLKHAPKNIIVLISDGCGYNHMDAASLYQSGRTGVQVYEHFPVQLAMSTHMYLSSYDPARAWTDFEYVKDNPTDWPRQQRPCQPGKKLMTGPLV